MSDAAIIAIVSGYVSMVGVIAWLVYSRIAAANAMQAMDDERDKAIVRAERAEYERDAFKQRLDDAERMIDALAEESHDDPAEKLNPLDVAARLRRAAAKASGAGRDPVPASAEGTAVPPRETTAGSVAAEVPHVDEHDPDGLLQPD